MGGWGGRGSRIGFRVQGVGLGASGSQDGLGSESRVSGLGLRVLGLRA